MKKYTKESMDEMLGEESFDEELADRNMPIFIGIFGLGLYVSWFQLMPGYIYGSLMFVSLLGLLLKVKYEAKNETQD